MSHEPITPMVFRILEGDCIALMPFEPASASDDGWLCDSYMHVGQHSTASPDIIRHSRPARPEEYASLKRELESAPYHYRIRVLQRIPSNAYQVRQRKHQAWRERARIGGAP